MYHGPTRTVDQTAVASGIASGDLPSNPPGYELIEEVGRGGMGVVYRARDVALGRDIALKLLQERFPVDGGPAQRFLSEARITAQLQHPAIPAVHQVGRLPDGRPFLAMKLIKGNTLDLLLKARQTPGAERGRLLAVFEAVCQAVGYAHAHRVIHRDLKPANVMVGAYGEVQVMDWGLAKILDEAPRAPSGDTAAAETAERTEIGVPPSTEAEGSCTQAGSLVGTPAFVSPEQAAGELEKIDARADVFGLGALLAVILSGDPPYVGKTAESIRTLAVRGVLDDCFARLDACGAEPELVSLCKRCLAFEPADRPHDGGEVAAAVAGLRAAAEERAKQAELDRAKAEVQAVEQRKRRKVQAALGATVAGLVILGGAFAWWQDRQAAEQRRREEETTRRVEAALAEAAFFRQQAESLPDPTLWAAAVAAGRRAAALAESGGLDPVDRDRARQIQADLSREAARRVRTRRLIDQLLEIRTQAGDRMDEGDQDFDGTDDRYARAFREFGVDVEAVGPDRALAELGHLDPTDRVEVAAAFDDWAHARRLRGGATAPLVRIARELDPDPIRDRIRVTIDRRDLPALRSLARHEEVRRAPLQTINLVAVYLGLWGDSKSAIDLLLEADRRYPGDYQINTNLGFFYMYDFGNPPQPTEALRYATAALAARPRSVAGRHLVAGACWHAGRLAEAASRFRELTELQPGNGWIWCDLGDVLSQMGDRAGALDAFRQASRVTKSASTQLRAGDALCRAGETADGVACYREAIRLDPKHAPVLNRLAWLLATGPDEVRDGEQAVALATRACEQTDWKVPDFIDTLAAAYAEAGEFDQAVEFQKKVLSFQALDNPLRAEAGKRLELYERKAPYREPPPPRPAK